MGQQVIKNSKPNVKAGVAKASFNKR